MWIGHVLPQTALVLGIPIVAGMTHSHGLKYYSTLNFCWANAALTSLFLTSHLAACYLRAVVVASRFLEPSGAQRLDYERGRYAPSPVDLEHAVRDVARSSRLEMVLYTLFVVMQAESVGIWLAGMLYGQRVVGASFPASLWLQFILLCAFLTFVVFSYPRVFRSLRVGILRREKERTYEYVARHSAQLLLPTTLLQLYVVVYVYIVITIRSPPVSQSLLYFSSTLARRDALCANLGDANCTVTYDRSRASNNVHFTPTRPDAIVCPSEAGFLEYESRYTACFMALLGDDVTLRGFFGVAAATSAIMTVIAVELLYLIPFGVRVLFHPRNLVRPFSVTGMSWAVKLTIVVLELEVLTCAVHLLMLGWSGAGEALYESFNLILLWFGLPKVLTVVLLLTEFMRRRFIDTSGDMYTTLPDGHAVSIRAEVIRQVGETLAADHRACDAGGAENRFASEARQLVLGAARDAALGVNFYMRVDKMTFAMPSFAEGVARIVAEFEEHGTDVDRECLHYCLRQRAGDSDKRFDNGGLMRDCDAQGRLLESRKDAQGRGMALDDFVRHPAAVTADLQAPHVLALRLYSTAAFRSLNGPLRDTAAERKPHTMPVTINFIREAISQLRAVEADGPNASRSIDLWRGLKNIKLADDFARTGGTELAPMSTTTSLAVAIQYSCSASSLILKVKTGSFMDRGADLGWVSAFPAEAEVLFPPLTFLQPTGRTMTIETHDMVFNVVEVESKH